MAVGQCGYREIEHTADWQIEVWAASLADLFVCAAQGMYALAGARLAQQGRGTHRFRLNAHDVEELLVNFLSELLYLSECEGLGFDSFTIQMGADTVSATAHGAPLLALERQIKAVTYHDLVLKQVDGLYTVQIVFDV